MKKKKTKEQLAKEKKMQEDKEIIINACKSNSAFALEHILRMVRDNVTCIFTGKTIKKCTCGACIAIKQARKEFLESVEERKL